MFFAFAETMDFATDADDAAGRAGGLKGLDAQSIFSETASSPLGDAAATLW